MPKINHSIMCWARDGANLSLEEAAKTLGIRPKGELGAAERLAQLESGVVDPTRPMLLRMSKKYRRPLLVFYMDAPPVKADKGHDFRTLPIDYLGAEEPLVDALIRDVQARQEMVRAALENADEAIPLEFVGSTPNTLHFETVLHSIQSTLQLPLEEFRAQPTPEAAFAFLRSHAEAVGVFVLLVGNLGSHHSAIPVELFRGFAIADKIAPFVVINDQDAKTAWSFTLLHELAHVWLGETGVSGGFTETRIEKFCNDIASELLLPSFELEVFNVQANDENLKERISEFASGRHVSSSMVAYRLYRNNSLSKRAWVELSRGYQQDWYRNKSEKKRSGSPDYYVVRRHRIGAALLTFTRRMVDAGVLSTTKAAKVLGVKSSNVGRLLEPNTRMTG